jgi:hypothetical protein
MEIIAEPDVYAPILDANGVFVDDKHVNFNRLSNGIRCPCSNRKHIHVSASALKTHFGTAMHKRWLEQYNANSNNSEAEVAQLRAELTDAKRLIAQKDLIISQKDRHIRSLVDTIRLMSTNTTTEEPEEDLLDFD